MPLRLKSRQQCPPNGFLYEDKHTGWKNWESSPGSEWDFRATCMALQQHRINNKARYPYLITDYKAIEDDVDEKNADRCSMIPGAQIYIMDVGGASPKPAAPLSQPVAVVAGQLKQVSSGARALDAWRNSKTAVSAEQSEARAKVCSDRGVDETGKPFGCPKNSDGDWRKLFIAPVAAIITRQIEEAIERDLKTSLDDRLNVCMACGCPLRSKVHVPGEFVTMGLTPEIKAELDPKCWIISEGLAA